MVMSRKNVKNYTEQHLDHPEPAVWAIGCIRSLARSLFISVCPILLVIIHFARR